MKKSLLGLLILAAIVSSGLLFMNCSGEFSANRDTDTNASSGPLSSINFFSEARPAKICGPEGYAFLNRNYIRPNCGGCHSNNGLFSPYFAALEEDIAFSFGSAIPKEKWIITTTHNQFCGERCSIDVRGEVYQGLLEWLESPLSCQ